MFNLQRSGDKLIEDFESNKTKFLIELEQLSKNTFEVFDGNKIVTIKNKNLEKLYDMQGFKKEYRHRHKNTKKIYQELTLKKFYFNLDNMKIVLANYKLKDNFKTEIYNESVIDGPIVNIIKENNEFILSYGNYTCYEYKMTRDSLWYVLNRIAFFIDNNFEIIYETDDKEQEQEEKEEYAFSYKDFFWYFLKEILENE